jgi:peptidoglycan/LPS O-acetylase OafA/YrhL
MPLDLQDKRRKEYFPEIQYLRVLAISYVFVFHFTARRASLLPYGQEVERAPWNLGWQGVYLFFIISGFVIAISLDKSTTAIAFIKNRLIRIYPALFVILPITYLIQRFVPYSEFASRSTFPNLVNSMLLIPPTLSNSILGLNIDWLTLVLWSLKVEVCFYIFVFVLRSRMSSKTVQRLLPRLAVITGLFLLLSEHIAEEKLLIGFAVVFLKWISFDFLNWFTLGIILRKWSKDECSTSDYLLFTINLTLAIGLLNYHELSLENVVGLLALVGIMVTTLSLGKKGQLFKNRFILNAGNSSYEMYLIHQGIGFTIFYFFIEKYKLDPMSGAILAFGVFLACMTVSYAIWNKINRKIGEALKKLLKA